MTLVLTVLIFISCIAMLAIGVMFSRKPLKANVALFLSSKSSLQKSEGS